MLNYVQRPTDPNKHPLPCRDPPYPWPRRPLRPLPPSTFNDDPAFDVLSYTWGNPITTYEKPQTFDFKAALERYIQDRRSRPPIPIQIDYDALQVWVLKGAWVPSVLRREKERIPAHRRGLRAWHHGWTGSQGGFSIHGN